MFITEGAPPEPRPQKMVKSVWWRSYVILFVGFSFTSIAAYLTFYRTQDEPLDVRTRASSDEAAPVVAVVGISNGMKLSGENQSITAVAFDDDGVGSIKIFIDDQMVIQCTDSLRCPYEWDTRYISSGRHVIEIVAEDTSRNQSQSRTTLTLYK